jgi:hypothetical protein
MKIVQVIATFIIDTNGNAVYRYGWILHIGRFLVMNLVAQENGPKEGSDSQPVPQGAS